MKNQFILLILSLVFIFCINVNAQWVELSKLPSTVNDENFLIVSGSDIFAGTGSGIYLSTDNGTNWNTVNNGLPDNSIVTSMAISGSNTFAVVTYHGVYVSSDRGLSWTSANNGLPITIGCLLANGNNIFAGTESGVYLTTDNGTNWTALNNGFINLPVVYSLLLVGNNIFSGGTDFSGTGIYLSTDNAANCTPVNNGLPEGTGIYSMAVINNTLIGSTRNFGLFRRPLSEMVLTDTKNNQSNLPSGYTLQQNYPNPFNPTTTITYSLPKSSFVTLKIYDLLGREVTTLVNEEKHSGMYKVTWNAQNLPSGVYFNKITTGQYTKVSKMLLLK